MTSSILADTYHLCIESSEAACSVCVSKNGQLVIEAHESTPRQHLSRLSPMIDTCLRDAMVTYHQLSAIVVSEGPGSYTGLRAGYATAKGLCLALDIPLIEVPSLEALVDACISSLPELKSANQVIYPMINGGRDEICVATYLAHNQSVVIPAHNITVNRWLDDHPAGHVLGSGAEKVRATGRDLSGLSFHDTVSRAQHLVSAAWSRHQLSLFASLDYAEPKYMKPPYITTPKRAIGLV